MKELKLKKQHVSVILLLIFFLTGCNQEGSKTADISDNPDKVAGEDPYALSQVPVEEVLEGDTLNFQENTSPAFNRQFKQVVAGYLAMKNAFVQDNAAAVTEQAQLMLKALNNMPDSELSGRALAYWQEKKEFLIEHLKLYGEAETLAQKRENFAFLSTIMVKAVQAFGFEDHTLYVSYCPMANNDRGAYWLSQTKQIQNPYMGQKMLNCGEVKKEI